MSSVTAIFSEEMWVCQRRGDAFKFNEVLPLQVLKYPLTPVFIIHAKTIALQCTCACMQHMYCNRPFSLMR